MASFIIIQLSIVCLMLLTVIAATQAETTNSTPKQKFSNDFKVAKCRQRCFLKTMDHFHFRSNLNSKENFEYCRQNPHCYMCFDYCRVFTIATRDLARSMCSDLIFCSKGCRIACNFHRIKSQNAFTYEVINKPLHKVKNST